MEERERRKRSAPNSYDEVRRRAPRRTGPRGYLERSGSRTMPGGAIAARVVGPAAVEQIVGGRYEWRDAGMRPLSGSRKRHWDAQEADERRRRRGGDNEDMPGPMDE